MNHYSYNLFLDDFREPSQITWVSLPLVNWEIVRSFDEFVAIIGSKGVPKFVSFDFDLCDEHMATYINYISNEKRYLEHVKLFKTKCGFDCLQYLLGYCDINKLKVPMTYFHTINHYGAALMQTALTKYAMCSRILDVVGLAP